MSLAIQNQKQVLRLLGSCIGSLGMAQSAAGALLDLVWACQAMFLSPKEGLQQNTQAELTLFSLQGRFQ